MLGHPCPSAPIPTGSPLPVGLLETRPQHRGLAHVFTQWDSLAPPALGWGPDFGPSLGAGKVTQCGPHGEKGGGGAPGTGVNSRSQHQTDLDSGTCDFRSELSAFSQGVRSSVRGV